MEIPNNAKYQRFEGQEFNDPVMINDPDKNRDCFVYRISNDHVAKVLKPHKLEKAIAILENENDILAELHDNGRPVAKPEGMFNVLVNGKYKPALVMQHIDGEVIRFLKDQIPDDEFEGISKRYFEAKQQINEDGFVTWDNGLHNAMYSRSEDKVYVIDAADWERVPDDSDSVGVK